MDFATDSLLDLHPPLIFQIDGNMGGTAAVLEMLLQSYGEVLHFLPALPACWPDGRVRGLRARGGYTVGMRWRKGGLEEADVVSVTSRTCTVKGPRFTVRDGSGKGVETRVATGRVTFEVRAGERYVVSPP